MVMGVPDVLVDDGAEVVVERRAALRHAAPNGAFIVVVMLAASELK